MKIGILLTGRVHPDLVAKHGEFDDLFSTLLENAGFTFETYAVVEDVFPQDISACDGWLITGSKHSAYDDLPWIARLEDFLRDAYQSNIPIVGICFGHQVLAKALGGKVAKYHGGWDIGPVQYQMQGHENGAIINAWHQDQVLEKPDDARVVGSSPFCKNAAFVYGRTAFTIQPHPELDIDFTKDLLELRRSALSPQLIADAEARIDDMAPSTKIGHQIAQFFRERTIDAS